MKSLVHAFRSKRLAAVLLLGFSSGVPLALTGSLLQAWMTQLKVDLTVIGIFALVGMPYSFKFLWAPLMDRYMPPLVGARLGRRRGWILLTQVFLALAVCAIAFSDPAGGPGVTALLALLVAFFSASQDIVVDAYRVDVLEQKEYGLGSAINITGYRIGMLVSGSIAFILADHIPVAEEHRFRVVYLLMALTMGIGMVTALMAPEPEVQPKSPKSLRDAVVLPFVDFFKRPGSIEILIFIILYKLDVVMATALTTPFMLQLGFTKTDIGVVNKGFGLAATILGTIAGGTLMLRLGMKRSLWAFGIVQGISTLTFMYLAHVGHHYPTMVASIALENFFSGMGGAAYSAFMMSLCNPQFTATQYALLTSLMALSRVLLGSPTGFMAKGLGWEMYYLVCTLAAIPSLLLLLRFDRWKLPTRSKSKG